MAIKNDTQKLITLYFPQKLHTFMNKGVSGLEEKERFWKFLKYFYVSIWFYESRSVAKNYDAMIMNYIRERKLYPVVPDYWLAFFSGHLKHELNGEVLWDYNPNESNKTIFKKENGNRELSIIERCEELMVLTQFVPYSQRKINEKIKITTHDLIQKLMIATDFDVEKDNAYDMMIALQYLTNCNFDEDFFKVYNKFSIKGNEIQIMLDKLIERKDELSDNEKMVLGEFPYNYERLIKKDEYLLFIKR